MKMFDLSAVLKERRFLGVRVWMCTFPLAAIGFFLFLYGYSAVGVTVFMASWVGAAIGFLIHVSRWRDPE
jgi:hypothetical protein